MMMESEYNNSSVMGANNGNAVCRRKGPLHKVLQAICGSNKKWILLRFVALFAFSLIILCCIYGLKSSRNSEQISADAHYAVGDSVYSGNLWMVIELESDANGVRTSLGKAMALHVCSAIKASQTVGWTPLVVGGSSKCCKSSRCRHLHPRDLKEMKHFSTSHFLNKGDLSSAMKAAAFLAAIQRDAHFIFHANPELYYKANVSPEAYQEDLEYQLRKTTLGLSVGLVKTSSTDLPLLSFNPYVHFGPSELMLDGNATMSSQHSYKICEIRPPSIEKFLDSDGESLDMSAPPLTLPGKTAAPFDSRNCAFAKEAFWSLLLLLGNGKRRDEQETFAYYLRSVMAQNVLAEISGSIKFSSSRVSTKFDVVNAVKNSPVSELSKGLEDWQCSYSSAMSCFQSLARGLSNQGFLTKDHIKVVDLWVRDLTEVGYEDVSTVASSHDPHSPCIGTDALHGVHFHSSVLAPLARPPLSSSKTVSTRLLTRRQQAARMIQRLCPAIDVSALARKHASNDRHDHLLLIVTFYNKEYHNIPLLEVLYRHHFKNILYCGEPDELVSHYLEHFSQLQGTSFSFLPVHRKAGYECLLGAVEMGYHVKGFLVVDQKTLINSWNFHDLDLSTIWHGNEHTRNVTAANFKDIDPEGKFIMKSANGILKAFQFLERILLNSAQNLDLKSVEKREVGDESVLLHPQHNEQEEIEDEDDEEAAVAKKLFGSDQEEEQEWTTLSPEIDSFLVKEILEKEDSMAAEHHDDEEDGIPSKEFHISLFGELSPQTPENNILVINTNNEQAEIVISPVELPDEAAPPVDSTASTNFTFTPAGNVDHHVSDLLFHPANFKTDDQKEEEEKQEENVNVPENPAEDESDAFFSMMVDIETLHKNIHDKLNLWLTYKTNSDQLNVEEAREALQNLQCDSSNNAEICNLVGSFFQALQSNQGEGFQLFYDDLPVYYVPAAYKDKLYLMANLFTKYNVANEMAFPLLLRGLSHTSSWVKLLFSELIANDRKPVLSQPQDLLLYTDMLDEHSKLLNQLESAHYLYPVDMKAVLTNDALRNVICKNF